MRNYKKKFADSEKKRIESGRPSQYDDAKPAKRTSARPSAKKDSKKSGEAPKQYTKPWDKPYVLKGQKPKPATTERRPIKRVPRDEAPVKNTSTTKAPEFTIDPSNYIYGRNAVIEALRSDSSIEKIYLQFGAQGESIGAILSLARKAKVTIAEYDKIKFFRFAKDLGASDAKTQGVIALKAQIETLDLSELIEAAFEKTENPLILLLDEISDPHNLGAIARSAECAGAAGLILPNRNAAPITPVAVKTSAGALERIPVAKVNSLVTTIEQLKEKGFWVIGAEAGGESLYELNPKLAKSPLAIVIGAEGQGVRSAVIKKCDKILSIPLQGEINSLNASVAAGVFLFEICRVRGDFGGVEVEEMDMDMDIEY